MKIPFTIPILLIIANLCFAQNYTPFYLDDAKWTMERIIPVMGPEDGHLYWEIYTLNDTLIGNYEYKILATKNICELIPVGQGSDQTLQFNDELNNEEFIFGGIREENKKIYFRKFEQEAQWSLFQKRIMNLALGEDHLLYDFNHVPGDTIHYSDISSFTVIDGDTTHHTTKYFSIIKGILSSIQGHNRYEVANSSAYAYPNETEPLLEGIGSSYGLFGPYDSFLTYLKCFSVGGEVLLFNDECEPCSEFVSSTNINELGTINIYPNPFVKELYIANSNKLKIEEIRAFNLRGALNFTMEQQRNDIRINFHSIQKGMIFLHLSFEDGSTLVKKIVSM